jgi:toxin-antitoxin system PIN domain toxin
MHLPDINVWLALTFEVHAHHRTAKKWFEGAEPDSCAFCRLTQQGFLRLATNPAVFKDEAVTMDVAWACYDSLLEDERVYFMREPEGLEEACEDIPTRYGTMRT